MLLLICMQKELNIKQRSLNKDRSTGLDLFFKKPNQAPVESQEQHQPPASSCKTLDTYVLNDCTLNAEILWYLKVIKCHFSLRSCEGLGKLFRTLFRGSELASKFSLGKTKCAYTINFGSEPYLLSLWCLYCQL